MSLSSLDRSGNCPETPIVIRPESIGGWTRLVDVDGGRASYAYAVEKHHDDGYLVEGQVKM